MDNILGLSDILSYELCLGHLSPIAVFPHDGFATTWVLLKDTRDLPVLCSHLAVPEAFLVLRGIKILFP